MKCGDEVARSQKNKPSPEMTKLKEHHQTSFFVARVLTSAPGDWKQQHRHRTRHEQCRTIETDTSETTATQRHKCGEITCSLIVGKEYIVLKEWSSRQLKEGTDLTGELMKSEAKTEWKLNGKNCDLSAEEQGPRGPRDRSWKLRIWSEAQKPCLPRSPSASFNLFLTFFIAFFKKRALSLHTFAHLFCAPRGAMSFKTYPETHRASPCLFFSSLGHFWMKITCIWAVPGYCGQGRSRDAQTPIVEAAVPSVFCA